jgi:hypothetical protein
MRITTHDPEATAKAFKKAKGFDKEFLEEYVNLELEISTGWGTLYLYKGEIIFCGNYGHETPKVEAKGDRRVIIKRVKK